MSAQPRPGEASAQPRLYDELARWWPLISPPEEYAEEAAFYASTIVGTRVSPLRTILELGSGGGNNASFLKLSFSLTLVDLAPAMLEVSRALNPECEHVQGDMRTLRLGRKFDAVFVHDAVMYMTSEADLRRALRTAAVHCRRGGVVLVAPDHVRETFRPQTEHGGDDGGSRGARYLQWTWDPDPADTSVVVDYAYLLRETDGSVRAEHDRHVEGLFPRDLWLRLLREQGVDAQAVPFPHSEVAPGELEVFVGIRGS
jgi:SAM-dependent methyltransferase